MPWNDLFPFRTKQEVKRVDWNKLAENHAFLYTPKMVQQALSTTSGGYGNDITPAWQMTFTIEAPAHIIYMARTNRRIWLAPDGDPNSDDNDDLYMGIGMRVRLDGIVQSPSWVATAWSTGDRLRPAYVNMVGFLPNVAAGTHTIDFEKNMFSIYSNGDGQAGTDPFRPAWRGIWEMRI